MKKVQHKLLTKKVTKFISHKKKRQIIRAIKIPMYLLIVLSIGINIYILLHLQSFIHNSQSLIDTKDIIQRNLLQIIDDTKEIRQSLSLPELLYEFNDPVDLEDTMSDIKPSELRDDFTEEELLIQQANTIIQKFNVDKVSKIFTKIIAEYDLANKVAEYNFTLEQKNTTLIIRYKKSILATIKLLYDKTYKPTEFQYDSMLIGSGTKLPLSSIAQLLESLNTRLQNNLNRTYTLRNEIFTLLRSQKTVLLFLSHRAHWKHLALDNSDVWRIYNFAEQEVAYIELKHLNAHIKMDNIKINALTLRKNKIIDTIRNQLLATNYKSYEDSVVEKNTTQLLKYISAPSFQKTFNSLGLEISFSPRIESDHYYFDIIEKKNTTKIGSFSIQRSNGTFWTTDKDDVPIAQENIFNLAPKASQLAFSEQNILLVGSHNKLADTIIIVNINEKKQVKLISIPRDLYYKGRKLNWYFKRFSHTNFNKLVTEVVGIPITQYVFVDMYAFVSIIDILGGINVTLNADLIDTSYKIKENGVITYLQYSKGEHYLSGIEALRVARSRYSANDFDRAARQQSILHGMQAKLNSIDQLSSFITAFNIIDSIKPYITTNISTIEIVQMIQKYRNASIANRAVLSTSNILYSTYSNIYEKNLTEEELSPDNLGQWILLPLKNDWKALQVYVQQFIIN